MLTLPDWGWAHSMTLYIMTPDTSHPRHRTLSRLSIKSICLIVDKKQCFVTRVSKEESKFVYNFNTNKLHKLVLLLSEFKFLWLISILNVFCRIYHHYYYFSWILRMFVFSECLTSQFLNHILKLKKLCRMRLRQLNYFT